MIILQKNAVQNANATCAMPLVIPIICILNHVKEKKKEGKHDFFASVERVERDISVEYPVPTDQFDLFVEGPWAGPSFD